MESNNGDLTHFCYFAMVSENLVGQSHLARYINVIADFHVAHASY